MSHARIRVSTSWPRALTFAALAGMAACATLEIQSPFQGRAIALADATANCTESARFGQWYLLFGVAPVIRTHPDELFPAPDSAYRVRTEYDWLDAAVSLIGGSFLSLHKNTLVVERCAGHSPAPGRPSDPVESGAPETSSGPAAPAENSPAPESAPAPTSGAEPGDGN